MRQWWGSDASARLGVALEELIEERFMPATRAAAVALSVSALLLTQAAPVFASGGDDAVRRAGSCSASTDWTMKAKADDGRIEVEAEIDGNRVGQDWHWKLKQNRAVVASGSSRTKAPSGSFTVERKPANHAGTDHFVFRAVNPRSGEVCRATVSW